MHPSRETSAKNNIAIQSHRFSLPQPKLRDEFLRELTDAPRPICDLKNPNVLYERFGYKNEDVCWIIIYKIPRLNDAGSGDANSVNDVTSSRCLTLPQIRNAYVDNVDTAQEVDDLEKDVDELERKIDFGAKIDWSVLALAILNAVLTTVIVVIRQRLKRLADARKAEERKIIRQRLPAGDSLYPPLTRLTNA